MPNGDGSWVSRGQEIKGQISLVAKKTPTLLQKNLGSTAPARLLFSKRHSPPKNDEEDEDDTLYTTDQIAQWYPEIYSSLELAYGRCECGPRTGTGAWMPNQHDVHGDVVADSSCDGGGSWCL